MPTEYTIEPSGDESGETDSATIKNAWESGASTIHFAPGMWYLGGPLPMMLIPEGSTIQANIYGTLSREDDKQSLELHGVPAPYTLDVNLWT